jgi:hypothetical protein
MLTSVFEKSSFDTSETAILLQAYAQAVIAVGSAYELDNGARAKLAKIILAVANNRVKAGGKLVDAKDSESVATIASERFLHLIPD